jgi:hypothetical protein
MNQSTTIKSSDSLESPKEHTVINVNPISKEMLNNQIIFQSKTKFKSKYCGGFSLSHYCAFNELFFVMCGIFIIMIIIIVCMAFIPRD